MNPLRGGYSLIETMLCLAVLTCVLLPAVNLIYAGDNFYLDREMGQLLQTIRYLEKKSLNTNNHEAELKGQLKPELQVDIVAGGYDVQGNNGLNMARVFGRKIEIGGNISRLTFNQDGRPSSPGHIILLLPSGWGKSLIIDTVGRVRIEKAK